MTHDKSNDVLTITYRTSGLNDDEKISQSNGSKIQESARLLAVSSDFLSSRHRLSTNVTTEFSVNSCLFTFQRLYFAALSSRWRALSPYFLENISSG